jgi:hypothetical protein
MKNENIPEFKSLEEERKYWEERAKTPGRWTKNKPQKRSSFLALRLTGEELTRLRDAAAKQGIGPSTFAREAIFKAMDGDSKKTITLAQAIELMTAEITEADRKRLNELYDSIAVPSIENPILLWYNENTMEEAISIMARAFCAPQRLTIETKDNKSKELTKDAQNERTSLALGDSLSLPSK